MPGKARRAAHRRNQRSPAQQLGSAALTEVMKAWEDLTDEERLAWRVHPSAQRRPAVNVFRQINLRRLRRGAKLLRLPGPSEPYESQRVLKGLKIANRGGRITLTLELWRSPATPRTVWGALPCNRGLAKPDKCPRLGWLPPAEDGVVDITDLYFGKHGERIVKRGLPMAGKRIFIRLRQETDDGPNLYEEVKQVVPPAQDRRNGQKSPFPFVTPS